MFMYSPTDITQAVQERNSGQVICWQESLFHFFDPTWKTFVGGGAQWKLQA